MKKTKKLFIFLSVGLFLFSLVAGLYPPIQGQAYAAPQDTDEEVRSYIYARAIAHCLDDINTNTDSSEEKADKFDFLQGNDTFIGYLDGDNDGKTNCNESWVQGAYAIWNMGDSNDGQTAACYSGFNRTEGDEPASVCARGTGGLSITTSNRSASEAFIKNVTRIYYGKESTSLPNLSKAGQYLFYSQNFIKLCNFDDTGKVRSDYGPGELSGNQDLIYMTARDGKTETVYKAKDKDTDKNVTAGIIGNTASAGEYKPDCGELATRAREEGRPQAYATANNVEEGDLGTDLESGEEIDNTCAGFSFVEAAVSLNWITCPLIDGLMGIANSLEDSITGFLCINEGQIFNGAESTCGGASANDDISSTAFENAWNVFRILGLGLIAIAGLVMVISQALKFDFIDAYTVKKVLPRILVAGIMISLSWPLLQFLVTLSNNLGIGIRSIIYTPFTGSGIDSIEILNGGAGAISAIFGVGVAGYALFVLGGLGMLAMVGTAVLALFIAFLVLVIRNILVIMLIILAPLAIAAYVLPNTEKYGKIWWDWLLKGLMVFPIITAMIAIGHVFAAVTSKTGEGFIATFVVFLAYFAPYFLIPAAFRFAGGAIATIGGFANDRSRGGFDRLSKIRQNQSEKNMQGIRENRRYNPRANGVFGKVNRGLNTALNNVTDPVATTKIAGGSMLRKAGFDNSIGQGLIGQVNERKFAASQKATELLMSKQFNDQALRSLMGMEHATPQNIRAEAARLSASSDVNSRIAGNQLSAAGASLATSLYNDPEMGTANLQAAAGMALAQHGFADPDDIAQLGNQLGGTSDGFANAVVGQAQMNAARAGRSDFKPGYSVRLGPGNKFEGTTDSRTRKEIGVKGGRIDKTDSAQLGRARAAQIGRLKGLGNYEMQQAKPATLSGLSLGYQTLLSNAPGKYNYTDDRGQSAEYEFTASDQQKVLSQFASMKSDQSGSNADQIKEIDKILEITGRSADVQALVDRQTFQPGDPTKDGRVPGKDDH